MNDCEQFAGREREICEGVANLPLYKINRYRERWGLRALRDDEVTPYVPPPVIVREPPIPSGRKPRHPQRIQTIAPRPATKPGTGCGGCGKRKKRLKLKPDGAGPGSQLMRAMDEAGVPHCQACIDLAAQMDAWGPAGCSERLGEIVEDILPRARDWLAGEHSWAHRLLAVTWLEDAALRLAIRRKVEAAIEAAR